MGPLAAEAEGMMQLVVDGLDDLAHPSQPTARAFGPGMPAIPLWRAHQLGPIVVPPVRMSGLPLEALIADIRTQGGLPNTTAAGVGLLTQGKEGLGQWLILGTRRAEAEPRDHPPRIDRHEQME